MSATVSIGTLEGLLTWKADSTELDKSLNETAKKADVSRTQLNAYNREVDNVQKAYNKLIASIDPAVAAEQKLEKAKSAVTAAFQKGLIGPEEYAKRLTQVEKNIGSLESPFKSLIEHVAKFTGAIGPVGAEAHEMAEGVGALAGKVGSLGEMVESLGPLLPAVIALGAALVTVGVGFAAFEFIKDAVDEGLVLQGIIERLNDSLKNTGSYSGMSSHEIIELAGSYALLTGRTKGEEVAAALELTRFKNLNEDAYPKALDAVNAYARALGITAEEGAKKLAPMLDGNTRALRAGKEAGIEFTSGQQAMLKSLVDSGNIVEYQNKLFAILKEKVGLAADAHETLGIQAGRVKFVYDELKEGIASELIPALEDLGKDIFGGIDDWKSYAKSASDAGHWIGDTLRQLLDGFIVMRHGIAIAWDGLLILIDKGIMFIVSHMRDLADLMSSVPGPMQAIWEGVSSISNRVMKNAIENLGDDTIALYKNRAAIELTTQRYVEHRQALEGDTDAHKKHHSALDDVNSVQKKQNDLFAEAIKCVQAYTDKFSDLADKLIEVNQEELALNIALQAGLESYSRELLIQERRKAEIAAVTQLEKEHRTEVEKLQALQDKAKSENRGGDVAKIQGMLDASNASFAKQKDLVGQLAGANVDLKHSNDALIDSNKTNLDYTGKQLEAWAQLTDELTGTTTASREASIQAEISRRVLDSLKHTQDDLTDSITETVRREHEFTNSMKDALDVARTLTSLNNQASLQTSIARIDAGQSKYLQQIEQQYLQIVAGIGRGSIDEGRRIIDQTQTVLDVFGIHIGNLSDLIKKHLKDIQDAEISKQVAGASKTPYELYKEERDRIEQYIHDSSTRTTQQIKDAQAYIDKLDNQFWTSQASEWASALGNLGSLFGGFLDKIASGLSNAINNVVKAYQSGNQIGGLLNNAGIGGAGLGGALGGILAEVQIFYEIYSIVDKMIQAANAHKFGTLTQLQVIGGEWSSPSYFDETGKQASIAIRNLINTILKSIDGELENMPQITIRARADGKKFGAYVAGIFAGEFDSAQEAMQAAVLSAIKQSTFSKDTSRLVSEAIRGSQALSLDQLQQDIALGETLATQNLDQFIQQMEVARQTFRTQFEQEIVLYRGDAQAFMEAVTSSVTRLVSGLWETYYSITGKQEDPAVRAQRISDEYNRERAMDLAQIKVSEVELEALRANLLGHVAWAQGVGGITHGVIEYTKALALATKPLEISTNDIIAAIDAALAALHQAENDIPPPITPGDVQGGHKGGGKGSSRQSIETFIADRTFQLQLNQMDQFHQTLAQITHDYAAQLAAAGKDKKLREELLALQQQETAAAVKAHQQDIASQFSQLIGGNDPFAQVEKPFEDLKKQIIGAGFGADRTAKMIDRLTKAEADAVAKLSMQQFSSIVGDLSNIIADSDTNAQQHLLHNELLRAQEVINYQIKMIELRDEYVILKAKGKLTQDEIDLLDKAFGWIDANADVLPGGKDWVPSFEQVTTAANSLSDAAASQSSAANDLKNAAQSLVEYQTSLHTDSSLGLVNSREALDNSKSIYETIAAKALTGDVASIAGFKTAAETYRKNLIDFSPSSELAANVLSGIDATINKIKAIPAVAQALSPDTSAIVGELGNVTRVVTLSNTALNAINDNTAKTPSAISDAVDKPVQSATDAITSAQNKTNETLQAVSDQIRGMANNVLAFRTESRTNADEMYIQLKHAADTLDTVASNTRPRRTRAGVGG